MTLRSAFICVTVSMITAITSDVLTNNLVFAERLGDCDWHAEFFLSAIIEWLK